ncbi:NADH-ubiquinone oxidoreductase-F iron-sulfur binding region domain-containing protein [Actinoplanes sp. TFC3]|uniref:NADH-ubiquinone oxidoreductase-F iron-sulfur binding region domain-containing protein n=1 Tax=Actinoplanes sp. TFC3 TaxID=1710355 RepID=UPI0008297BFA|nr:NADH-ubiquinone oxidoreductase-F iron-sulfur binding region domain-containing protein [Actinoplanes sp. TFC3]
MTTVDAPPGAGRRLLAGSTDGRLDPHLARYARAPRLTGAQLVALLRDAGLTGRGGAGFPAWRKVDAVLGANGVPVVVGNGSEGEPASGKDRALLAYQPHLVLDGLQVVAQALGARQAHLYVSTAAAADVRRALDARRDAGLDAVPVTVTIAPDRFVAGEESALVNAVSGKPAVPSDKRLRVTEAGVNGSPTLVQNVETLGHIALLARFGPQWFREAGTSDEPGTFLATVSGAVQAPGVVEAAYGVRLSDLVDAAGGPATRLQALLLGGYHGGWVPALPDLPFSRAGLAPFGATPGAGVVVALAADGCGLMETARIAGYLAGEVAGQCGPCINGLPRLAATLGDLARRRVRPGLTAEVERLSALVSGRGACRHPDGTVRMVRSAMRVFEADVAAHLAGWCVAPSLSEPASAPALSSPGPASFWRGRGEGER